jgi:DNA uptake protein ComE-like DNA-binding protein
MPKRSGRVWPVVLGVTFALIPWVTLGCLTPVAFGLAAARMRSWLLWLCTAVFTAGSVTMMITSGSEDGTTADTIFNWALGINFVGGGVVAAVVSSFLVRRMWPPSGYDVVADLVAQKRADLANDPALRLAVKQQERRRFARELVADKPALADDLAIGRPDKVRDFDDGGLIDVNNVDLWVLTTIEGIDYETAKRIVAARQRYGALTSVEDLIVYADVPHEVVDGARELLIFRTG